MICLKLGFVYTFGYGMMLTVLSGIYDRLGSNHGISPEGYHHVAEGLKDNDALAWLRYPLLGDCNCSVTVNCNCKL